MKKFISFLMVLCMLASMSIIACADSGFNNSIKNTSGSTGTEFSSAYEKNLDFIKNSDVQQLPKAESYLERRAPMYLDSGNNSGAHAYAKPKTSASKLDNIFSGSQVWAIAIEGDWACVSYSTIENEEKAGWVYLENLSDSFPGETISFGNYPSEGVDYAYSTKPLIEWSKENFVDTKTKFSIIEEKFQNEPCIGLTVDYQVVSRNGITKAYGGRDVYINDGNGWDYVGSFDVPEDFSPIHCEIRLEEPMVVKAVAVIPQDLDTQGFIFRMSVVDMMFPIEV